MTTPQPERPVLARLFAEQLTRLNLTTDGEAHQGALPDLELDPSEITEDLARELQGMQITIPAEGNRWGVFGGIRPVGEDLYSVAVDDDTVELPHTARVHVTSKSWRAAGGGPIPPLDPKEHTGLLHGDERAVSPDHVVGGEGGTPRAAVRAEDVGTEAQERRERADADAAARSETRHAHLHESEERPRGASGPAGSPGRF